MNYEELIEMVNNSVRGLYHELNLKAKVNRQYIVYEYRISKGGMIILKEMLSAKLALDTHILFDIKYKKSSLAHYKIEIEYWLEDN